MVTFFLVKCAVSVAAVLVSAAAFFYFGRYLFTFENNTLYLDVNSQNVMFEVDEKFLSVALDVSFMRCYFHKFREREWVRMENLSRLLSPGYLRFGGNDADRVIFDVDSTAVVNIPENVPCEDFSSERTNITITGEEWAVLNKFAQRSGLSLIVDLNALLRNGSRWNSSNAEDLIEFSAENGFPLDFQLGNEPNNFRHVFNFTITGKELARDFRDLKEILNSTKRYNRSKLIGPDVTRPKNLGIAAEKFLEHFLGEGGNVVDVVSWHQYYLNGRTAVLEDFLKPETFDLLPRQVEKISEIVRRHSQTVPIWLSETSTAYGCGAPKLSDRFAASFLWLDKLGIAARMNTSVVIRQSLFKGHYALISDQLDPAPDFWISVLFKNLVGKEVLSGKLSNETKSEFLRLYCHCLAPDVNLNGSLVIYGMNLSNDTELVIPSGITVIYPIYSYTFRPEFNNLRAKDVLLNDVRLRYNETIAEDMIKMRKEVTLPLIVPPHSIAFWVVNENSENACTSR